MPDFSKQLQARGRSVATLHFDTEAVKMLRGEQVEHVLYHLRRMLLGEPFAPANVEVLGITVEVEEDMDGGPEE